MSERKPYILLAFANARAAFLEQLDEEEKHLNDILDGVPHCRVRSRREVTYPRLTGALAKVEDLHLFHFSGHAGPDSLLLVDERAGNKKALVQGMAKTLGKYGAKLAFLNGCSTRDQVEAFHEAGIPVVISTVAPVSDKMAREFAGYFYTALARGESLQAAFETAENDVLATIGPDERYQDRGFEFGDPPQDPDHPYTFQVHPKFESVAQQGIRHWYHALQRASEDEEGEPEEGELLGPYAYLLCNRRKETELFEERMEAVVEARLKGQSHKPQVLFICGPSDELPDSLARRYFEFTLEDLYSDLDHPLGKKQQHPVFFPPVEELRGMEAEEALWEIEGAFRREFRMGQQKAFSSQKLIAKIGRKRDCIAIQHDLLGPLFPALGPILKAYIARFWQIPLEARAPQVLVVFNVSYDPPSMLARLRGSSLRPEALIAPLAEAFDNVLVVPRLEPVAKADVLFWQRKYLRHESDLVKRLFSSRKQRPMAQVEEVLKSLVEQRLNAG